MIDFLSFDRGLRNSTNIGKCFKNREEWDIIISTLKKVKHNMLVREDFVLPDSVYHELAGFDKIDLIDLEEYEKELWTSL